MNNLIDKSLEKQIANYFEEDELFKNLNYLRSLPSEIVKAKIIIKSDLVLSGLDYFQASLNYISPKPIELDKSLEGKKIAKGNEIHFDLPFNIALSAERIALNLLQRSSAISTYTNKYVSKAHEFGITILDTRKTTPGHRTLEKYAVTCGGGKNHRFSQLDVHMVKDNHKTFFGGVENAISFFKSVGSFYNPIVVEIHDLKELELVSGLGVNHFMLDNFSPEEIKQAIMIKKDNWTYEASGGIRLENLDSYLVKGLDAISVGALTYDAPHVDISFKYEKINK